MAVDDKGREKKPAIGMLRRALASPAEAGEACPDLEILAAYADRALDAEETARYELHFSQCAHCREQLAAIARAAAPVDLAPVRRLSWIWTWGWIALAPVTAMLLIAAVLVARRPAANRAAEAPAVAMQPPEQAPPSADQWNSGTSKSSPNAFPKASAVPQEQPASASRVHSEGGNAPPAPPPVAGAENYQKAGQLALEEKDRSRASASDYALNIRNEAQADKAARQAATSGTQAENGTVRSQSQTVTVEAQTSASEVLAPTQTANGAISKSAPGAYAGAPAPSATAKKQEPSYTVAASNNLTASQTATLESMVDRDVRTVVRSPDPEVLWRISGGRYVEQSRDAGATWHAQWTSVNARVVAGSAPSVDTCWLVGSDGIVLVTTNGKTWHALEAPAKEDFVAVAAADASSATITGSDGRKFETRDAGKHWIPAP